MGLNQPAHRSSAIPKYRCSGHPLLDHDRRAVDQIACDSGCADGANAVDASTGRRFRYSIRERRSHRIGRQSLRPASVSHEVDLIAVKEVLAIRTPPQDHVAIFHRWLNPNGRLRRAFQRRGNPEADRRIRLDLNWFGEPPARKRDVPCDWSSQRNFLREPDCR